MSSRKQTLWKIRSTYTESKTLGKHLEGDMRLDLTLIKYSKTVMEAERDTWMHMTSTNRLAELALEFL